MAKSFPPLKDSAMSARACVQVGPVVHTPGAEVMSSRWLTVELASGASSLAALFSSEGASLRPTPTGVAVKLPTR